MRDIIFIRVAAIALAIGFFAGIFSASFSETEIIENYGAWIPGFYECNETELWVKAVFSGTVFVVAACLTGLFVFGYIFVYPISFYYGYTFGFIFTCAVSCFGVSTLPDIIFRIPSMSVTAVIICGASGAAVKFSSAAFSGLDFFELRAKTSKYLTRSLGYILLSLFPTVYEAIFVPKILNLWDSF